MSDLDTTFPFKTKGMELSTKQVTKVTIVTKVIMVTLYIKKVI